MHPLSMPIDLPCGVTLPNRICKTAMSEFITPPDTDATIDHGDMT